MQSAVRRLGAESRAAFLVLQPGDELHACVRKVAADAGFHGGFVSAIGAVDDLELGYFRLPEKVYDRQTTRDRLEVVSLTGNLAVKDGEPFLHAHGVFTGPDFRAFGGHVFRAVASITLEVSILDVGPLVRLPYPEFGLSRIDPTCPL
jgi:predicted DNA-binding protein with PD1-like motif